MHRMFTMTSSILDLPFEIFPELKRLKCFVAQMLLHGDVALRGREHDLLVDLHVVEADGGGVFAVGGVDDAFDVGPAGGGEAHGAGFAVDVKSAAGEVEFVELCASGADGDDFGVGGGIAIGDDAVVAS